MRLLLVFLFVFASNASAVEAHYNIGVELKPLPILMTSMGEGQGLGVGFEMSSSAYGNWVLISSAEVYRGPRNDDGMVPQDLESSEVVVEETNYNYQQITFGLRRYSNKQDDTYYVGGELAVVSENQEFEYDTDAFSIQSQSLRPMVEFGYRWVWQNGSMFRLGLRTIYINSTRNRLEEGGNQLPDEWRQDLLFALDEAEKKSSVYATMDIGVGYTF